MKHSCAGYPIALNCGIRPEEEFHLLFQIAAEATGCFFEPEAVDHLLSHYYRPHHRPLRRCHARDLLLQVRHYCAYNDLPFEMRADYFDRIAGGFFTEIDTKDTVIRRSSDA